MSGYVRNEWREFIRGLEEHIEELEAELPRIEQLEAEVESWKNSYERAVKEGAELIRKAVEEGEYEQQDTTAISG